MRDLNGRRWQFRERYDGAALITGASSGFGTDFARALASDGMDLILVARREPLLRELAGELERKHGIRALVIAQDLTTPDALENLSAQIDAAGLKVGLLINNAGYGAYGHFVDLDTGFEGRMVDLNCRVPVELTHHFVPAMVERGRGGIIIVASMAAYQPVPYLATYGATKAFDLMLAEALWAELRPRGIDVLALSPGYVDTGFQAVADSSQMGRAGQILTSKQVVRAGLDALGNTLSVIPGSLNKILTAASRFSPRRMTALAAEFINRPPTTRPEPTPPRPSTDDGRLQRDVVRMLLTFLAVVAFDVVGASLLTGKLRLWFPVWIDPNWATNPDAWVVYSQSYFAGIFFIPLLLRLIDRDFLTGRAPQWSRIALWSGGLGVLGFILWWKGGLMIEHGKHMEAIAWLSLTALVWCLIAFSEQLSLKVEHIRRQRLLRTLMLGVACFFLVMAVLDPLLQVGVQHMSWSTGLIIEVAFFVPAGLSLLWAARRMRAA